MPRRDFLAGSLLHKTRCYPSIRVFFFFNDTATTEIYTLSLHDALPISNASRTGAGSPHARLRDAMQPSRDRKSTRLNSSHITISYAVFCLKKTKLKERLVDVPELARHFLRFFDPSGRI